MKPQVEAAFRDRTTIIYITLLLIAGSALLAGSGAGLVSLDRIERFWPVTLVAAGLMQLLSDPERKQS